MRESHFVGWLAAMVLAGSAFTSAAWAADPLTSGKGRLGELQDLLGQKKAPSLLGASVDEQTPKIRAALTPSTARKGDVVTLSVSVTLPPDSYTYTTNPEVLGATRFDFTTETGLEPKGEFEADHAPKVSKDESTGKPLEKLEGGATFLRQYIVTTDHPHDVRLVGTIHLNYCNSMGCRTTKQPITASLAGNGSSSGDDEAAYTLTTPPRGNAQLTFRLSPRNPKPGDIVTLDITMHIDQGWHTYSTNAEGLGVTTTKIKLDGANGLRPIGDAFLPDHAAELFGQKLGDLEPKEVYFDTVTWSRRFKFEPAAGKSQPGISGSIRFGICNDKTCLQPRTESFRLGNLDGAGPLPAALADDEVGLAMSKKLLLSKGEPAAALALGGELWFYLGLAFVGGIILNVLPCVLPVLAIKVLSFVQQAGESRSRIFLLNVAYTGGVLATFLTLAILAVTLHIGWGGLFQQMWFNLIMACLVFAMGLSLLGVFEIPVPGMVGSAAAKHQREGFLGAFLTGIFATLLATPCTGPLMATAVGWTVTQPPLIVFLVFGVMGLGMASPYLFLGLFPRFVNWLPKPGTWMVRFKEFAGFVLLGSVIFIIYYTDKRYTVPLLVMLLGVSLGLWMIGNLYDVNSHIRHKTIVRASALVLTGLIVWIGYALTLDYKYPLPWEPFSDARIASLLKEEKTVLVDFTAEWCANCHVNEYVALNTRDTQELVKKHHVVTLLADYTKESPEITRWLHRFKQNGVPLTVIFPAGRQDEPIVLTGLYTKGTLLEKLTQAIQTKGSSARVETAASLR